MSRIVNDARKYCLSIIDNHEDIFHLRNHLPEAEKWAKKLLKKYKEADGEVLLLSVWLHDVSHYVSDLDSDHAIRSEKMAKDFLEQKNYDRDKLKKVLHCVRAHRNRDVAPSTLEAKLMACVDSASHMTDYMYIDIMMDGRFDYAFGKVERDYRDIGLFPEIQKMLTPLYESWKRLLTEYKKLGVTEIKPSPFDKV